jgi:uncharacterized protein
MNTIEVSQNPIEPPKEVKFDDDDYTYIAPSENYLGVLTYTLSQKIRESGKTYDRLIYLPRGGLAFARPVIDCTEIDRFSDTTITSYSGVGVRGEARITKPLTDPIEGENILVLDDVADSGNTIIKSKEYLLSLGALSVDIATAYYKERSTLRPDYFAEEIKNDVWIIFPGERVEFMKKAAKRWHEKGHSYEECKSRFIEIGIPNEPGFDYVDKYLPEIFDKLVN